MSKGGKRTCLSRALAAHAESIRETLQMLENPAPSSLDKVDWSQVIQLGDQVSKQATVAGMLWSGDTADVEELESNMGAYCNMLHGFLLLCHGSTVDAGPTLHANIKASAKQVIDCSLSLLKEAVSSCESCNSNKKLTIPQLAGSVWEACTALKKTPTTNCTAIGRAITQVAVSVKDVLREMRELKLVGASAAADGNPNGTAEPYEENSSSDDGLGDDLSPEEMGIAELAIGVVTDTLAVMKELIRFVTCLVKKSNSETASKNSIGSLERLLSYCREMEGEVNELGASLYPPQEIPQMKLIVKKMYDWIDDTRKEAGSIEGSLESLLGSFTELQCSLGKLECALFNLDNELVSEMVGLAV